MAVRATVKVLMMIFCSVILLNVTSYVFYSYFERLPQRSRSTNINLEIITKHSTSKMKEVHQQSSVTDQTYGIKKLQLMCDRKSIVVTNDDTTLIVGYLQTDPVIDQYTYYVNDKNISICPEIPPELGPMKIDKDELMNAIKETYSKVERGGYYKPDECVARETVAILVPLQRAKTLYVTTWLHYMHVFLMKQQLEYNIFFIQHDNSTSFNKGKLMNIGYLVAKKFRADEWGCLIFHEPHLLPINTRNLYRCDEHVKQLFSILIGPRNDYMTFAPRLGGVVAMTPSQFVKVNGFSNNLWGDESGAFDDMYERILITNQTQVRSPEDIGSYIVLEDDINTSPYLYTNNPAATPPKTRYAKDGLTTLYYKVRDKLQSQFFTYIKVSIFSSEIDKLKRRELYGPAENIQILD